MNGIKLAGLIMGIASLIAFGHYTSWQAAIALFMAFFAHNMERHGE